MTIENVADTALWIAAYRARESERPDAVFHDPLARRLAGPRGEAMVEDLAAKEAMAFAMVARTTAIDRLVLAEVARGADLVVNLGAGLDTRPYRLDLPADLRWIEVDFPATIAYKEAQLAGEAPRCRLERIGADLSLDRDIYARLGAEGRQVLVITEGLLGYLENDQARQLALDLAAVPTFRSWIMDYARGPLRREGTKHLKKTLEKSPVRLRVADPVAFFGACGWRLAEDIGILDEADRLGRAMPAFFPWNLLLKLFPWPIRGIANRTFGYARFTK